MNSPDREVLALLREGRVTPLYSSDQLGTDRGYLNQRLKRLVEHGHADRLASELYELADDPRREGDEADLRARLQDAIEARDDAQARANQLEGELEQCRADLEDRREQLAEQPAGDLEDARRALDDLEAACERGRRSAMSDELLF